MDSEILIVEDEAIIAIDIEQTLNDAGFAPTRICNDSRQATAYLAEATPRAALLDLNLSGGETSLDVARELAERGCPFLFLTGYTNATGALAGGLEGVLRIAKPFEHRQLVEAVNSLLSGTAAGPADSA